MITLHYTFKNWGKQTSCNLAPRKMRGIESQGMILMAEDGNGKLHFVAPEHEVNPGAGVI